MQGPIRQVERIDGNDLERMDGIEMIKIMNFAPIDYCYYSSFLVVWHDIE